MASDAAVAGRRVTPMSSRMYMQFDMYMREDMYM
jgi:hypothetical protein